MQNLQKIKELSKKKNMKMKDVAESVGITPTGLAKIIRNNVTKMDTLIKIAKALDVPVTELLSEDVVYNVDCGYNNNQQFGNSNTQNIGADSVELSTLRDENKRLKEELLASQKEVSKLLGQVELLKELLNNK